MYPEPIEPYAPAGKIRLIGTEHNRDWKIADVDENTSPRELAEIAHVNRGLGIDIRAVDSEGNQVSLE